MKIQYHKAGDYYLPNLVIEDTEVNPIGKYHFPCGTGTRNFPAFLPRQTRSAKMQESVSQGCSQHYLARFAPS